MIKKVQEHLSNGELVKIFTARVNTDDEPGDEKNKKVRTAIQEWCLKHIGKVLPITCVKDYEMILLYDDRAVQIIPNTGITLKEVVDNEYVLVKASNLIAVRNALIANDAKTAYSILYESVEAKDPHLPWNEWENKTKPIT